jgi:type VI secretion system secreted protein Hcp
VDGFDGLTGQDTAALSLTANGQAVPGDSTVTSQGREDTIECLSFRMGASTGSASAGLATSRRRYDAIVVRKRTDRSTPLLWQALITNQVVEGTVRFFRPDPSGDGTTQQYFTVRFGQGRVSSVRHILPMTGLPDATPSPLLDEVAFSFQTVRWTYEDGGIETEDTVGASLR